MKEAEHILTNVTYAQNSYDCLQDADALVIVTEWDEFRALDMPRVMQALKTPTIIDLRNIYRPENMKKQGFQYASIGRPFC